MRYLLYVILIILPFNIFGQCESAQDIPLDGALIYPLPFGVFSEEEGGTGIDTDATIGEAYEFSWTIVLPDTFTNNITFQETYGDSLVFFPDSISYIFNEERIDGLPDGLTLEFSEENGVFKAISGQAAGCIKLSGTPSTEVVPGDYMIVFRSANCVRIPDTFEGCQYADIPSAFSGFPGEYRLTILEDNTSPVFDIDHKMIQISPTIADDFIQVEISDNSIDSYVRIHDLNGVLVHSEVVSSHQTKMRIATNLLRNGLYFMSITHGNKLGTQKFIVFH